MGIYDRLYGPFERVINPFELPFRALPKGSEVGLVLHFAGLFRPVLVAICVLSIAAEAIGLYQVWSISFIVDNVSSHGIDRLVSEHFYFLALICFLIFPITPLLSFLSGALGSQTLGSSMPAAMQWQAHSAIKRQDMAFFHETAPGQLSNRVSQLASAVQQQIVVAVRTLPSFVVKFIGSAALLGLMSWQLSIPVGIWIFANILLSYQAIPRFAELAKHSAKARSEVVGAMTDIYAHMHTIKIFASEQEEDDTLRQSFDRSLQKQQIERRSFLQADNLFVTLNSLLWLSVFLIGLSGLKAGFVSVGDFVGSITIVLRLTVTSRSFLQMGQQVFQALGTIRDVMPIISNVPEIVDRPDALPIDSCVGRIRFDRVSFGYHADRRIIDDFSLEINAGEKIGIVGYSGAGKSTLINLLLRLFDVQEGVISIDGRDIRSLTQASLRKQIGVVTQDASLLHRSVGDNISFGRTNATRDEIISAANMAMAHDFITDLKDGMGRQGLDAFVGDRGIKLSGGQRQRIGVARVILKNAPILVLDEATSALDSDTEAAIQQKLSELMKGKTVIAIAHRLSTIAQMDRLIVIDKGRLAEEGSPETLLNTGGIFSDLWKRQNHGRL